MKTKLKIILLLISLVIATKVAVAQSVLTSVDAEAEGVKEFFGTTDVEQNDYIAVKVKVTVSSNSPSPLRGFDIKIRFVKPDYSTVDAGTFQFRDITLNPGQSKEVTCNTQVKADQLGNWQALAYLYDTAGNKLAQDELTFKVVEKPPIVSITITQVFGYTTVSALLIGGWYAIRNYFMG
jgi:hypothetical protein